MKSLVERFERYLNTGIKPEHTSEVNRQIFVANLFSFIGYTITFLMGISAFVRANYILSFSLLLASALFYFSHYILKFDQINNAHKISSRIVLSCLLILMIYLVKTGGYHQTGPLWMYIVPPVAFFFGGLRRGLMTIAGFVAIVIVLLFYPEDSLLTVTYTYEFKTRLLYSFLTVTSLFAFYEYSRQESYKEIQELSQKFERQARQDSLTNLPNRRGMTKHLEYEFNRSQRSKQDMSVLLCDIDHFKKINDTYGHDAGDCVLVRISDIFQNSLRKQDIVARWGGEEFLFMLPETHAQEAYILAEKIRKKISEHAFTVNEKSINVTVSIGISPVNDDYSIEQAINLADHFLYQAKAHGRNKSLPEPNKG